MSLWHAEREFRSRGEEFAANSLKLLREKFGEIPLPQNQEVPIPLSKETQQLIERLKKDGYAVYDLEGRTPKALKEQGMKFWYLNSQIEDMQSNPSLVALNPNPDKFFLRNSFDLPHFKQLELLDARAQEIEREYPGAGLVVREGSAPEWVETPFLHSKATGNKLFGPDYKYRWTWTNTHQNEKPGAGRAVVGSWGDSGLGVSCGVPGNVYPFLGLAPLVEIPRS